jgi:DNA polymerase
MSVLYCDIETYSGLNLADCGVYAYAKDPSFEILLAAVAFGDEPVRVVDVYRLNHDTTLEDYFGSPGIDADTDRLLWEQVVAS